MIDGTRYRSYTELEKFIQNFYSLLQTIRIHSDNHKLVKIGITRFINSVSDCLLEPSLTIKIANGRVFVDDEMLTYSRITKNLLDNMVLYFDERSLEGLRLHESIKLAPKEEILVFMHLFDRARQQPDALEFLETELLNKNITWLDLLSKPETESPGNVDDFLELDKDESKERAIKDYTYVLASFKEVAQKITGKGRVGMRKTIRVVQDMVKHILIDDEVYSAISTLRIFDDYTFTHSVNVAILSMCLGKRLDLSKRSIERLGICALLHDLGKINVPFEILNKPGSLTISDFKLLEEHSLNSARLIVKLKASRDRKAKILVPPFEHHLKYDLSGYPHSNWKKPLTLFGRIITITDVYDAITSPRVYRKSVLSPDRALGYMLDGSGRDFDPVLLKVFINMLGIYPVGTLLKLDSGELALVVSASKRAQEKRPLVCLMNKEQDGSYSRGETVDLAERDQSNGNYCREILETYHPSTFGIQPVQHIFAGN